MKRVTTCDNITGEMDFAINQITVAFPISTVEIEIWVKTLEDYHSFMIDPWSMCSQLRDLDPWFCPYPLRY